jgi:tetratricopeptide (TPR) repeat protein
LGFGIYDGPLVHRPFVLAVALAALMAAASLVWVEVRQEREFRTLIAVGDAALGQGQPVVAIEAFSGALALKPTSMLAYLKRGDAYRRRGEFTAALRDLSQAAALDDTAPQPLELLGDVNAAQERHDRAVEFYQRCLQHDDRAIRVLYKLGLSHIHLGQAARAIEPLERVVALDDRLAEAHYLLGMSLRAQQRADDAVAAFRRTVELRAGFIAAREELAELYASRGRSRDSIEELEAIAALEPRRPERLVAVGLAYARIGRRDTAIATLGRAAERYPGAPVVYAALGRLWLDAADSGRDAVALQKAIEALQPVAIRNDATSEALVLYGRALLWSGRSSEAERVLQQAIARSPVDPSGYRDLADASTRLGHAAAARTARARYLALTGSS